MISPSQNSTSGLLCLMACMSRLRADTRQSNSRMPKNITKNARLVEEFRMRSSVQAPNIASRISYEVANYRGTNLLGKCMCDLNGCCLTRHLYVATPIRDGETAEMKLHLQINIALATTSSSSLSKEVMESSIAPARTIDTSCLEHPNVLDPHLGEARDRCHSVRVPMLRTLVSCMYTFSTARLSTSHGEVLGCVVSIYQCTLTQSGFSLIVQ